jgi:hypothetical protein
MVGIAAQSDTGGAPSHAAQRRGRPCPRAVFTRMYGACEREAPAHNGKLRWSLYVGLGAALSPAPVYWRLYER